VRETGGGGISDLRRGSDLRAGTTLCSISLLLTLMLEPLVDAVLSSFADVLVLIFCLILLYLLLLFALCLFLFC